MLRKIATATKTAGDRIALAIGMEMSRQQFNVRLPELTVKQIEELKDLLPAESLSHVVIIAIDRLYQELVSIQGNKG